MKPFDSLPDFCFYGGVRYEAHGTKMRKQIGASNLAWGLPKAPGQHVLTAGTSGSMAAGVYRVHCVGVTETGYKGMPFSTVAPSATVAATGKIDVTAIPVFSNPEIRYVDLYRTPVNSLSPYAFCGRVANGVTTITLNGSDDSLEYDDTLEPPAALAHDESAYAGPFRYEKPTTKKRCFAFDGRVFIYGDDETAPGAVSAVDGSTTFTFSGGLSGDVVGKSLVLDGEDVGYNIARVISSTELEADQAYVLPEWRLGADPVAVSCRIVGNPFEVQYSEQDAPDYFPWCNALSVGKDEGGTIRAGVVHLNEALFFTEANIFALYIAGDPTMPYGTRKTMSAWGSTSPRSVVSDGGAVYFFSGSHFCVYQNNDSARMDYSLGEMINSLNPAMSPHIKGCRVNDKIYWGVATWDSTVLNEIWVYDTSTREWDFPWTGLQFIDLESVISYEGQQQLWIEIVAGDGYSLQWFAEGYTNDGQAANDYSGTVSSASSLTLTATTAAFPTTGEIMLAGSRVAIASGTGDGQVRYIESNTADTLTVTEPWTVIPDATSEFTIGAIEWEAEGGCMNLTRPNDEKTFMQLEIGLKGM